MDNNKEKTIKLNIQHKEEDCRNFNFYLMNFSKKRFVMIGVFLVLFILVGVSSFIFSGSGNNYSGFNVWLRGAAAIFGVIVIWVLFILMLDATFVKIFRTDKKLQLEHTVVINDEGITIESKTDNEKIKWDDVYKIGESKKAIYCFVSIIRAIIIPKRILDNGLLDQIKKTAEEKLSPDKIKWIK